MKSLILALFLIIVLPLLSCIPDCKEYPPSIISGIHADNYFFDGSSVYGPVPVESKKISYTDYTIKVDLQVESQALINHGAGSTLMATDDCPGPDQQPTEVGMDTIYVVTLTNYKEQFVAGDTINTITTAVSHSNDIYPLTEIIQSYDDMLYRSEFLLSLTQAPSQDEEEHVFKVIMVLDNGDVFESQTDGVVLSNE